MSGSSLSSPSRSDRNGSFNQFNQSIKELDGRSEQELAPLFLFLASSFNVELVYVILKGITQFAYLKRNDLKAKEK